MSLTWDSGAVRPLRFAAGRTGAARVGKDEALWPRPCPPYAKAPPVAKDGTGGRLGRLEAWTTLSHQRAGLPLNILPASREGPRRPPLYLLGWLGGTFLLAGRDGPG